METYKSSVRCGGCGGSLSEASNATLEERKPCPTCGSMKRVFDVAVSVSVTLREKLALKHKRPGHKKPIFESVQGHDLHKATGKWNKVEPALIERMTDTGN